jgi:hypothetical protein
MWRTMFTRARAAICCLVLIVTLLLVTACGGGYSSPGGSPQATPTKGGYSIVWLFDKEMQVVEDVLHGIVLP